MKHLFKITDKDAKELFKRLLSLPVSTVSKIKINRNGDDIITIYDDFTALHIHESGYFRLSDMSTGKLLSVSSELAYNAITDLGYEFKQ